MAICALLLAAHALAQPPTRVFPVPPESSAPSIRTLAASEIDVARIRAETRFEVMPQPVATFALNVVVIDQSGWTTDSATKMIADATWILAQCGLRLRRATLRVIDVPQRFQLLYTPASRVLAGRLAIEAPAVFLVRDTLNEPAFDAEAFGRGNTRSRPELAGSVWLTALARDPGISLAHELVHVLADSGDHAQEPGNLMNAETRRSNTEITRGQCDQMLATGARNNLLIRLPR